jgi:multimeric flavodoxin WrbA
VKVLGINGSGRKDGNTAILIRTVFKELEAEGIETELLQLYNKRIRGCAGCLKCHKNKLVRCFMDDDHFNACFEKLISADGIILGSPVYSSDVTSQIKAFLDRAGIIIAANQGLLKHKVGVCVVAVRRGGAMHAFDTLNHFLQNKEVIIVGSTYWNLGIGKEIGEVTQDEEGMRNMKNLGQNMAWLMKRIAGDEHHGSTR